MNDLPILDFVFTLTPFELDRINGRDYSEEWTHVLAIRTDNA